MCDTMGGVFGKYAIFGKNSDRDTAEPQVVEWYPRRNDNPDIQTSVVVGRRDGIE